MKKRQLAKLLTILPIVIFMCGAFSSVASATYAPGCYINSGPATCPAASTDTRDTNGSVMDPATNCYTTDPTVVTPEQKTSASVWIQVSCEDLTTPVNPTSTTGTSQYFCGDASNRVYTSIDLGCQGKGNPIMDMLFGIIRFLSDGVGIVVIASIIVAGIQYSTSRGDPQASARAMSRIRSAVLALIIFIFAYAILDYIIPGTFLN